MSIGNSTLDYIPVKSIN